MGFIISVSTQNPISYRQEVQCKVLKSKILSLDSYKELNVLIAKYCDVISGLQLNIYYDLNIDKQHIKLLENMSH